MEKRMIKCDCPKSRAITQAPLGEDMHTSKCATQGKPSK